MVSPYIGQFCLSQAYTATGLVSACIYGLMYYSGVPITEVPEDPATAPRAHIRTYRCLRKSSASRKKFAVFAGTVAGSTASCITDSGSAEWTDLFEAVEPVHMANC